MKKKLLLSVSVLLLVAFLSACNQDKEANEEEDVVTTVETVEAVKDDLIIERKLNGRTGAGKLTPVMLQTAGEIESVEVTAGDKVEKNDLIATVKTPMGNQQIKAPKAGEVVNFSGSEGDLVSESEPFAMIADMKEMTTNASVTAHVRSLLKKGDKLQATIEDKAFEAEVVLVDKMPDETGLYPIEAKVENKDDYILPGMIATLHIPEERIKQSIILPTEAIVEDSDGAFVYVVKDDRAHQVPIDVTVTQTDQTAIKGEVSAGDEVIINGQLTLTDGSKVNVVKEGE